MVELFSCSVRYKFASSHLRRIDVSSTGVPDALLEERDDRRRAPPGRDAEDEARRCPALRAVLCRVMSLSEWVVSTERRSMRASTGGAAGGGETAAGAWDDGEPL